jgi:hypothetical protein
MLLNIIIIILFTGVSKLLNIKAKKISSTCWIRTGVTLNLSVHGTHYRISLVGIPRHVVTTISWKRRGEDKS